MSHSTRSFTPERLVDGLVFPESPRWHAGQLWLSDLISRQVLTVGAGGEVTVRARFDDDNPSGLGFLPDGDVLVALMRTRRVMRIGAAGVTVHANLAEVPGRRVNDMYTAHDGTCYLDNLAGRSGDESDHRADGLVRVDPDGHAEIAATGLTQPNGIAPLSGGRRLVVAETGQHRLTQFTIDDEGRLIEPQPFATVGPAFPDGICVDAADDVWFGSPYTGEFLHVRRGGEILDRIATPDEWAVACALGGPAGRTLFLVTARTTREGVVKRGQSVGFVSTVEVDVPATAGSPS